VTSLAVRDSVCRSPGGEASLHAFQLLAGLYRFTDAAWGAEGLPGGCNWPAALACVDSLGLLPAAKAHVEPALSQMQRLVGTAGPTRGSGASREPALRPEHVRHLLLGAMRCLHFKQQALRDQSGNQPPLGGLVPDAGSLADTAERAKALLEFASKGQFEHQSSDTLVELSQMMSGIAY
jgi:hypothetical protein